MPPFAAASSVRSTRSTSCGRRRAASRPSSTARPQLRLRPEVVGDPGLDQRLRQLPHVELGIERAADALGHHHGLLQQQQLRLGLHREGLADLEQLAEQAADRDLGQRPAADRLGDRAAGLHERRLVLVGRHVARGEMDVGDPLVVGGQEAQQHLAEVAPGRPVEPAHDAEIDRHQIALRRR